MVCQSVKIYPRQLIKSSNCGQAVWNSKMREELLEQMDAMRENPSKGMPPQDFQYQAIKVNSDIFRAIKRGLFPTFLFRGQLCISKQEEEF